MNEIENLVQKGNIFLKDGEFDNALAFFEQALLLNQDNPDLWKE